MKIYFLSGDLLIEFRPTKATSLKEAKKEAVEYIELQESITDAQKAFCTQAIRSFDGATTINLFGHHYGFAHFAVTV